MSNTIDNRDENLEVKRDEMDLMSEIGKKTSEVCKVTADKTNKIAKEARLKIKMASDKSKIEDLYEEIGKKVYENYVREEKQDLDMLILEECIEIDKLANEIEDGRKQILNLKDKKQCPKCFFEIAYDYHFCPNCGEEQEKPDVVSEEEMQQEKAPVKTEEMVESEEIAEETQKTE